MAALRTILAWVLAVATLVLGVEFGLRAIGLGPEHPPVEFDDVVGWRNRPSARGVLDGHEFTAHWSTDARGMRETPRASSHSGAKVLLVGDSFVFGTAVDERDTLAARLQAEWDAQGRELVALNGGVLGYDTAQAAAWFARYGADLAPRAVVLFAYENDLYWNTRDVYVSRDSAARRRASTIRRRVRAAFEPPRPA
ncbi:MAG: hypothetical protein R3F34_02690 [Planctomycetota bacterium]